MSGAPRADTFVSVVAPLRDEAPIVAAFVADVMAVLRAEYANYELVLVDDGSLDGTMGVVEGLLAATECLRYIRLSRPFGEEVAISAGLDTVIGDYVVVMLPNHDPAALIPELVRHARAGAGVVYGVRSRRVNEGLLTRLLAGAWYAYAGRFLRLGIPRDTSQFRALSRQAVNAVVQIRDKYRYLRTLSAGVGYRSVGVSYEPVVRDPSLGRRSLGERVAVTIDLVIVNSQHPLRAVTYIGAAAGLLNVLYALYAVAIYLTKDDVAPGWTTLSLQNAAMFFFVFVILTVMTEYVGHILVESRDRPLYHVADERSSPVYIADQERRNVVADSRL